MAKKRKTSENNRKFKGVWIPAKYWLDEDLTIMEVVLITEIDSLDGENGCFASNKHFADFLGVTAGRASQLIKNLNEKGYISVSYNTQNNVTQRVIRVFRKLNTPVKKLNRGIKNTKGVFRKCGTSNTSSNTSNSNTFSYSSAKKEEDPVRESIYNQFFKLARMNDDWHGTSTNPTLDQIKQLRSLLYQCKPETLQDALLKFSDQMKADIPQQPFIYLIKMLRDGLKGEKEWEKQQ